MKFLEKCRKKLKDFFIEETTEPSDVSIEHSKDKFFTDSDTEDGDNSFESTDTAELQTYKTPAKKKPEDPIKDSDYWWCFEGHSQPDLGSVFELLDTKEVGEVINKKLETDEFPVIEIPENIMRTMQILNNPDFDYAEVAELINHSPSMAGEFIRVINSSLFSRGGAINSLRIALPRLGKENIKALLYMYSSKLSFSGDPQFKDVAIEIVEHSYATALISTFLSQRYYPDQDGAFLAGLMHDIGKLGILKVISESYRLPKKSSKKITLAALDSVMKDLHPKVGVFLSTHWKLDETIISAVEHHHDFFEVGFSEDDQMTLHLSALINLSDTMARILGKGISIGKTNIFDLPATIDLAIEKNYDTISFLENIPKVISYKMSENS